MIALEVKHHTLDKRKRIAKVELSPDSALMIAKKLASLAYEVIAPSRPLEDSQEGDADTLSGA